jgi:hypothetical protein
LLLRRELVTDHDTTFAYAGLSPFPPGDNTPQTLIGGGNLAGVSIPS